MVGPIGKKPPGKSDIEMNKEKILVLDTETTGFDKAAEILQLSILNGNGEVLMNEYFRPRHTVSWAGAQQVNHISPAMVAGKPPLSVRKQAIEVLLQGADMIAGYNLPFDLRMLGQNGIGIPDKDKVRYLDLMRPFSETYGDINEKTGRYRWQKLITCAKYYGYEEGGWHDSLADTRATLYCFWKMAADGTITI